uniref:Uncharacterized protein n=1 Tax=Rhizophora mucronata TaxID=61149 RepID=A0A2P2IV74_RHIMU
MYVRVRRVREFFSRMIS